jgi:hypothetical protein
MVQVYISAVLEVIMAVLYSVQQEQQDTQSGDSICDELRCS